jgi:hypothetical protein
MTSRRRRLDIDLEQDIRNAVRAGDAALLRGVLGLNDKGVPAPEQPQGPRLTAPKPARPLKPLPGKKPGP